MDETDRVEPLPVSFLSLFESGPKINPVTFVKHQRGSTKGVGRSLEYYKRIVEVVKENPGITSSSVSKKLLDTPQAIHARLKKLEEAECLRSEIKGNGYIYFYKRAFKSRKKGVI